MIPIPPDPHDQKRAREQGQRRSIIEGQWSDLLRVHLKAQLGDDRADLVGEPDTSSNMLKQISTQIAVLYDRMPQVGLEAGEKSDEALENLNKALDDSRMWELSQRNQLLTIGVNDSVMGFRWNSHAGVTKAKVVPADHVWGLPHPGDDGQFGVIFEARERTITRQGVKKLEWVWDVWDVREPEDLPRGTLLDSLASQRPFFRVLSQNMRSDLTVLAGVDPKEWSGDQYRYRDEANEGSPILPYVAYHSMPHEGLWAPFEGSEIVFGTLQDGVNWTNTNHAFMRASWAEKWIAGGKLVGGKSATRHGNGKPSQIVSHLSDPVAVNRIQSDGDGSVTVGQWGAAVDIDKAERFARNYGTRLAVHFGLSPADVTFESKSPSSGVALTVSRAAIRRLQAKFVPQFRRSDIRSIRTIAIIQNSHVEKSALPTEGIKIGYASVELDENERRMVLENVEKEIELALVSRKRAFMRLNPGVSEDQAEEELLEILEEMAAEAELLASSKPEPETTPPPKGDPDGDEDVDEDPTEEVSEEDPTA